MVALNSALLDTLGDLVVEVREGYEAGAWAVTEALGLLPAFTDTNIPRSALVRSIIAHEFKRAAERLGLNPRSGLGGAVELFEQNGDEYAIVRLRSAEEVLGDLRVIANSGSTWGGISDDGLWRETPYVFGCRVEDDSLEFFVAEVVGQTDAAVPHLEFGWMHRFSGPSLGPGAAFTPDGGDSLGGWDARPEAGRRDQA